METFCANNNEENNCQDNKFDIMATRKNISISLRKAASNLGGKAHVISRKEQWVILIEGALRVSGIYKTKIDAVNGAMQMLKAKKVVAVIIHKKDGSIEKWVKR